MGINPSTNRATHHAGPVVSTYGFATNGSMDPNAVKSTVIATVGTTNTSTITIQLKDALGNNLDKVTPFDVYVSDAASGIGISATAASTGFSVASGGGVRQVTAVTKSIACVSSATGGCVLSLLDTAKTGYYVVVSVGAGIKVSTQLTAGSYG